MLATFAHLRRSTASTLVIVAGAFLASCAPMPADTAKTPPLDGTAWVLADLPGAPAPADAAAPTLRLEAGRASGSDGCNRFNAGVRTDGGTFEIAGPIASTRMACAPELMQRADAYLAALGRARGYRVEGGQLQLLDAGGSVRASFSPQTQVLAGTRWRATGINNGRGGVVSLVAGSNVTLDFAADGQASGSAGCNRFNTRYSADGTTLRLQPAAATRRLCPEPGVMEQESAFLRALETVATSRVEGSRLELRTADGALAASFEAEAGR
jgi:heat shock protein HslJ